jgi:phage terminase large subunit-like protein
MNYIREYYKQCGGTSENVRRVYKKLVDDLDNPGEWFFDETRANKPIRFIEEFCRHSKGEWAGDKIKLELFQKAYISALFGFVNKDGIRRYKETLFLVARKNGKSLIRCGSVYRK